MNAEFFRMACALLSTVAGLCLALMLLNRLLLAVRDSRWKGPLVFLTCGALTGGFALAGLVRPGTPWAYVPMTVLALASVGEVRRVVLRRACAGSPPVDTDVHAIGFLHPFTTTDVVVRHFNLVFSDWHGRPFRIAHLSDLHVNPILPETYYRRVLELAARAKPDLVFLTGDFVTHAGAVSTLSHLLRPVGRRGTFAVLGNHDYWAGADLVRQSLRSAGITLLTDETIQIALGGGTVQITGCDYPWGARDCAVPHSEDGILRLVLSHTPDNIYRLSRQSAHLVFSGHNHAGQLRIPGFGSVVVPSRYGRRFDHGHFVVRGTHLFVTSGVGAANPPLRVYCWPDIFVVDVLAGTLRQERETVMMPALQEGT